MKYHHFSMACIAVALSGSGSPAAASLIFYGQQDRDAWFDDVGSAETITFTEHPLAYLTTQYEASHGLTIDGALPTSVWSMESQMIFPNDGIGLSAISGPAWFQFDREMYAFAADFPGAFTVELYAEDELLHEVSFGSSGSGLFRGITLEGQSFSRVRIRTLQLAFYVDDLHFAAIPAPAAWALLVIGGLSGVRRRRKGSGDIPVVSGPHGE